MFPLLSGLMTGGASLLGSIFSSNTSAQNTQAQIAASQQQQQQQNQFTEQMSNTAYQRASTDMKAAGLNPMMMFGSGSAASTPSGSSIQAPMPQNKSPWSDLGSSVSKGLDAMVTAKTTEKMTEEIANLKASEALRKSEDITERVRPSLISADVGLKEATTRNIRSDQPVHEDLATSAKNRMSMNPAVRRALDVGSFGANKVGDIIAPVVSSATRLGGIEILKEAMKNRNSATSFRRGMDAGSNF